MSNVLQVGLLNAALDARERLLTWIERSAGSRRAIADSRSVRTNLRLIRGGRYLELPANNRAADIPRLAQPSVVSPESGFQHPTNGGVLRDEACLHASCGRAERAPAEMTSVGAPPAQPICDVLEEPAPAPPHHELLAEIVEAARDERVDAGGGDVAKPLGDGQAAHKVWAYIRAVKLNRKIIP